MITIGICDDEQNMRKILRPVVERTCDLAGLHYKVTEYVSGEALIGGPNPELLDILFLDIEMPGLDGMETARLIREKGGNTIIIFVTAYPDFVFQGYEVHAFHYILKPYEERKITEVLNQALSELKGSAEQYLTIEQKSGTLRLPLWKTTAFQSNKRKVLAYAEGNTIDFYGRLNDLAEKLPPYFVRIHNRCLANIHFVTAVEKDTCICGGKAYPVSRTYKHDLEIAFARTLLK